MTMRHWMALGLALGTMATPVLAQERPPQGPPSRDGRQADREMPRNRDSLEAQVRARMDRFMRERVGLTDAQLQRLRATNAQFERQRRELFTKELEARRNLRAALGPNGDTTKVATHLDELLSLQRQRIDALAAEQRQLAEFLTPVQRAKLMGVEEQLRGRMMEMRGPPPGPDGAAAGRRSPSSSERPRVPRPPE